MSYASRSIYIYRCVTTGHQMRIFAFIINTFIALSSSNSMGAALFLMNLPPTLLGKLISEREHDNCASVLFRTFHKTNVLPLVEENYIFKRKQVPQNIAIATTLLYYIGKTHNNY
jgi:hypothetical protein